MLACCDEVWSHNEDVRRPRTRRLIPYAVAPFVLVFSLQSAMATTTKETKFVASATCVRVNVRLNSIVHELLNNKAKKPATVHQVSLGRTKRTKKVKAVPKIKNVGIKYHYVLHSVLGKAIKITNIPADKNRVDSLTKMLEIVGHPTHCGYLSVAI